MKYFWKPLVWIVIITILSLLPGEDLPKEAFIPHFDKIVHIGMYFLSCLFFISPFRKIHAGKGYLAAFLSSLFIGALFEVLQNTVAKNRSGNYEDFIADLIGAALALIFYRYFVSGKKLEKFFKAQ
jgi:VanZ family protein